jgi:hypothetical protein
VGYHTPQTMCSQRESWPPAGPAGVGEPLDLADPQLDERRSRQGSSTTVRLV